MGEEKPLAIVEVYDEDYKGRSPRFKLDCKVNNRGQRWGMDIPYEVAEELYQKLGASLRDVRAQYMTDDAIQARGLKRDDYHVNPRMVRCAADDCTEHLMLPDNDDRHPWLAAQEMGWKRLKDGTDLFCPDSVKQFPKLVVKPLTLEEKIARAQEIAWRSETGFVNSKYVRCSHDHCGDIVKAKGSKHPWDLAREQGWRVMHEDGTDLLCADCLGPKEFCPWKKEDHSEAF